ncbi:HAD family hydrolase [Shewanella violacea]|uniref:Phosphoglycolate phosphatase, putative n=1 Tax=Shewanella violacea (strain JCM 10179 / CIP 106290 / LMG 19151 / DSS12) TaxID=637905 RepID=D4ZK38_SHEVD|nr:HAD-IA family hydrolase [Shewanella violacea]BAJ02037.1 phosphoglycolate phosphatase, putative [Shewanella violacea DSS12]
MTQAFDTANKINIKAVLFDLDGTLADTAPDLVGALNMSLSELGYPRVSLEAMRHIASDGSLAMAVAALPDASEEVHLKAQQLLLNFYSEVNGKFCHLFAGMPELLSHLNAQGIPFGIVTNKPARYTRPLIAALDLTQSMKTVISGDSTLYAKPHTAPMLLASQQIKCKCQEILYLGDAKRDLVAAHASGMLGGIALWGYISDADTPEDWPSDYQFNTPGDVLKFLS